MGCLCILWKTLKKPYGGQSLASPLFHYEMCFKLISDLARPTFFFPFLFLCFYTDPLKFESSPLFILPLKLVIIFFLLFILFKIFYEI